MIQIKGKEIIKEKMASINNSLNLHFTFYLRALATHKQGMHVQYPEMPSPIRIKSNPMDMKQKQNLSSFQHPSVQFLILSSHLKHAGSGSTHPDFKIRDSSQPGRT